MDDYESILKGIIKKKSDEKVTEGSCLSEEIFGAYLDNLLDGAEKERVEDHLYQCDACRKQSIIFHRIKQGIEKEELMRSPKGLTDRARQLVKAKTSKPLFEVVLEFAKDTVRILKDTGAMFTPLLAEPAARYGTSADTKNTVHLSNTFDEIRVDLIIEKTEDGACEINIKTSDSTSGTPESDVRINLLLGKRELASFVASYGQVSFKNIQNGIYELHIVKSKEVIGRISLELESVK
ncbi:MAG: zf-HC2 domain-containing protein [Nitrospirae bacterium]|nr:zf-HC2 domain-containing protein [Nitrospirota bacterium]